MAKSYEVQIEGLKDVQKALKAVDKSAPKQLRIALNSVADLVVKQARPLIPKRSGAAARSLKPKSTRTEARISFGGKTAPYSLWLEFGGRVGKRKSVMRPFIAEGRYIFPTIRKNRAGIQNLAQEGLDQAMRDAGLEVD